MSIVNISSENLKTPAIETDAEYKIKLSTPLMRVIGVQIQNVTIPLTYNIFNPDGNSLIITNIKDAGGSDVNQLPVLIPYGTYSGNELATVTTRAMQDVDSAVLDNEKLLNKDQMDLHIAKGINGDINIRTYSTVTYIDNNDSVGFADVKEGFSVFNGSANVRVAQRYGTANYKTLSGATLSGQQTLNNSTNRIVNKGFIMAYDPEQNVFILSHPTHTAWDISTVNSRRILKTYGFESGQSSVTSVNDGANYDGAPFKTNGPKNWGLCTVSKFSPELAGPSVLYLRIGGDILLDQQNSETHFHDRIPIPIDQPHGGVVHFENEDKTDVIPLSVPCDVANISFRFEYGDDNLIVGGATDNFRGHYTYVRLKFYFAHSNI